MSKQSPNKKLMSVSQSLIKNFWDYRKGQACGLAFQAIDLQKKYERLPSKRMSLGHYFEFLCTGQALRDGSEPERPLTSTKKPTADAIKVEQQAENYKQMIVEKNIETIDTGVVWEHEVPEKGFKYKGVLDVLCRVDGELSVLDIKSSGLIGNRWEDFGWDKATFNQKDKLTLQVVFYKYLAWKVMDIKDIPFYFAVHSSTNGTDSIFWRIDLADFDVSMSHLEDMVMECVEEIDFLNTYGFTPYPDVKRCNACPLQDECEHKIVVPETVVIEIDGVYAID